MGRPRHVLLLILALAGLGGGLFCLSCGHALWTGTGNLSDKVFLGLWGPLIVLGQGVTAVAALAVRSRSRELAVVLAGWLSLLALLVTVPPVVALWNGWL